MSTNHSKIISHSPEAKNALHRLTYSEDLRMTRMLEDNYDFIDAFAALNGLALPPKPQEVIDELAQRKADREICRLALEEVNAALE